MPVTNFPWSENHAIPTSLHQTNNRQWPMALFVDLFFSSQSCPIFLCYLPQPSDTPLIQTTYYPPTASLLVGLPLIFHTCSMASPLQAQPRQRLGDAPCYNFLVSPICYSCRTFHYACSAIQPRHIYPLHLSLQTETFIP